MPVSLLVRAMTHCFRTSSLVAFELVRLASLAIRSHTSLAAENLFLRKQLALFQERKVKPRRADDATRWLMATLGRMFQWRNALVASNQIRSYVGNAAGSASSGAGSRSRPDAHAYRRTSGN